MLLLLSNSRLSWRRLNSVLRRLLNDASFRYPHALPASSMFLYWTNTTPVEMGTERRDLESFFVFMRVNDSGSISCLEIHSLN